jgi:NET1-associated nuclear protein 1 (U3 small nucleolar RNA-associated protein 17)
MQCVAFDSKSLHVAAGDISGRIIIWSGLPLAAQRAVHNAPVDARTAGMKLFEPPRWHSHAVGALCFSHDGSHLLSGGQENVLVIWQLETLHKTFLPRLGGPITHITRCPHDASCYAIGQQDNAVRLVSVSKMAVLLSMYGVRPAAQGIPQGQACIACCLQPGSGYLLLPGRGGSVQLYDLARDCHVERLQVITRNMVSPTDGIGTYRFWICSVCAWVLDVWHFLCSSAAYTWVARTD